MISRVTAFTPQPTAVIIELNFMSAKLLNRGLILLITLIFFAMAVWQAGQDNLDVDELYEATLVNQHLSDLLRDYRVSSQLTHVLLTKLTTAACRDILCLRLGSIIAGTLGIPLIYLLGQKLVGRATVGIFSAILLCLAQAHLRYSVFIRGYALMTCLALVSMLAFWLALRTNRRRWWLLFSVAAALNIYNQIFSALLLVPLLIFLAGWLWLHRRNWQRYLGPILLAGGAGIVLLLPMAGLLLAQQSNTDNLDVLFNTDWPSSFPPVSLSQPANLLLPLQKLASEFAPIGHPKWVVALLIGFLLAGLYRGFSRPSLRVAASLLALAMLLPPLLLSLAATLLQPWFWAFWRFVIFVMVPYLILIGLGLDYLMAMLLARLRRARPELAQAGRFAVPALLLLAILPAARTVFAGQPPPTNPFAVARALSAQAGANDLVICVPDTDWRLTGGREPCSLTLNLYPNLASRVFYLDQLASYPALPQFLAAAGRCLNRYTHLPHPDFKLICPPDVSPPKPAGVWLVLWRNRDVSSEAALAAPVVAGGRRVGATDLIYLPNDTDINHILQDAGQLAVGQSATPLRRLENAISLATIYLATQNIPRALATLDDAAFVSRWPEAVNQLADLQSQLSFLPLPAAPERALDVTWNNEVHLAGIDHLPPTITSAPGAPIQVSFYWQTVQPPAQPYQILLHLVNTQDQPMAAFDFQPFDGRRSVTDWPVGQTIRETRTFDLPADLPPGEYRLVAGLYQPDTLARLPISQGGNGETVLLANWRVP
ncbi:MAG: hypothetical protein FOGNACKC_04130 [Anaerolineae bacterium]|nr:hypothetical protein [Anaerolineae bacterium]